MRWCGVLLLLLGWCGPGWAHVALTFPAARRYDLDFLDNGRTKAPCGMPKGDVVTTLPAGAAINVTWHLSYPHKGGFKLELLDANERPLTDLTPTSSDSNYVGQDDSTAQSYTVHFRQDLTCRGCTLRLTRQAREWGQRYLFWSCADVDIVPVTELTTVCSGHGILNNNMCECSHLYSGNVCQYKDECWAHEDCGPHGRCINVDATTYPKLQCFCEMGWFGEKCSKQSPLRPEHIDISRYTKKDFSDEFTLYWRILKETQELEAIMKGKGSSYIAIGWRPSGISAACKAFPLVTDRRPAGRSLEADGKNSVESIAELSDMLHSHLQPKETLSRGRRQAETNSYGADAETHHLIPDSEPEPVSNSAKPGPSNANAEPEPSAAGAEPEPSGASAEPEPTAYESDYSTDSAEPEPAIAGAEPEPSAASAEPEPSAANAEPEPSTANAEPEPSTASTEQETFAAGAEPEPSTAGAEPEPSITGAEPEPSAAGAEPEPSAADAEPEPSAAGAEPEPSAAGAEPEPSAAGAEPEPSTVGAEPEPSTGSAEPEPSAANAEPEPSAASAEPEPSAAGAEPEPSAASAEPEPSAAGAEPEPSAASAEPEPSAASAEPEPSAASAEPEPSAASAEPEPPTAGAEPEPSSTSTKPGPTILSAVPEPNVNVPKKSTELDLSASSPVPESPLKTQISTRREPKKYTETTPREEPVSEPTAPSAAQPRSFGADQPRGNGARNYPPWSPYTPRADFHPMDCTDIVIGTAHGGLSRVFDYYTRDRSTPRYDSYYGGKDDLTAALGFEVDGQTTIIFRKKLVANDLTDHTIENSLMDVIWARGQERGMYVHRPETGLETGTAKDTYFYRPDELKYHGHGKQRGKVTMNFFDMKSTPLERSTPCLGGWRYPAECSGHQCEYSVIWRYSEATDDIIFTITTKHTDKWTGLGFSRDIRMADTDAVIGWVEPNGHFTIQDVWLGGYTHPSQETSQNIYNTSGQIQDGVMTLQFSRKRNTGDRTFDLIFSDNDCLYLMFPVKGGGFNALTKRIRKHELTPVVSVEKVCIRKCRKQDVPDPTDPPTHFPYPEPEGEPEPPASKPEPEPEPPSLPEPTPRSPVLEVQDETLCRGEWRHPPYCVGYSCEYRASWQYIDETDEIAFTVSTKSHNRWTGIGFSRNRAMPESDAIIGWVEETGRFFIMDTWLSGYSAPLLDPMQNIHNMQGSREDGVTTLKFFRKRLSKDFEHDLHFTDEECLYMIYPVQGGVFNAVNKKIRKHEATPVISREKMCIRSCRPPGLSKPPQAEPEPPAAEPPAIETPKQVEPADTTHRILTPSLDAAPTRSSAIVPQPPVTTVSTATVPQRQYIVEVKLPQAWNVGLEYKDSVEYRALQQQLTQDISSHLARVPGFKGVENVQFNSVDETSDDVIASMNVLITEKLLPKTIRKSDATKLQMSRLEDALNSTIISGSIGSLQVDPAYLVVQAIALQEVGPNEIPTEDESQQGMNDEQLKTYVIIAGVAALILLVIIQASCMVYRDRMIRLNATTKQEKLITTNSHWKDYSATASSNYSYENFAMRDDDGKVSKHPVGSMSNGSALSKGSPAAHQNGRGYQRGGERSLPRNGYSASLERNMCRSDGFSTYSGYSHNHAATMDRAARSGGSLRSQQELQPDFYFMPHQRRYSGEVVRVYVDYNNPEYAGK